MSLGSSLIIRSENEKFHRILVLNEKNKRSRHEERMKRQMRRYTCQHPSFVVVGVFPCSLPVCVGGSCFPVGVVAAGALIFMSVKFLSSFFLWTLSQSLSVILQEDCDRISQFFAKQLLEGKPPCTTITTTLFHHREVSNQQLTSTNPLEFTNSTGIPEPFVNQHLLSQRPKPPPREIPAILFLFSPSFYELSPLVFACVAQEEEQSPINRKVGGSTPAFLGYMSKRPWARH